MVAKGHPAKYKKHDISKIIWTYFSTILVY